MRPLILVLCAVLLWAAPVHAVTLPFDSNFETTIGDEGWVFFNTGDPSQSLAISADAGALSGAKSAKGIWTVLSGGGGGGAMLANHFTSNTQVFMRNPVKVMPGFQLPFNGQTKLMRIQGTRGGVNGGTGGYPFIWFSYSSGYYAVVMEAPFDANNLTLSSGVVPRFGQWDQVEWQVKLNTPGQSNGEMRIWVNDVLRNEVTGRQFIGPATDSRGVSGLLNPSDLRFEAVQLFVQGGSGTIYHDRVAIDTTRIGLVSGGPPPPTQDTTPPSPPTALTVQ